MKRSLVTVLMIGLAAAALAAVLHAIGVLRPLEDVIASISRSRSAATLASEFWVYFTAVTLAVVVAWLTVSSLQRMRIGLLVAGLALELLIAASVCGLYGARFQPLPAILAIGLAFVATERWIAFAGRSRTQLARTFFADRLSNRQIRRLVDGDIPLEVEPKNHEVSVVVCDIANKYDMAEESEPAAFADVTEKFIRRTTDLLLEAGGYIQAADGEGVVAIFGFPDGTADHADKAVRVTLDLVDEFRKLDNNGD